MVIIDAHIHLWNRLHGEDSGVEHLALTGGRARQDGREYYATPPSFDDTLSTYQRALAHMDCLGIERAVVLQEFMDGKQDDYLAQVRRECPQRFSCMALFDKHYYDDPLGRFQHVIEGLRLQGFLVKTPDPFAEIAIPKLMPIWQGCAERGLPVVLKNGAPAEARKLIAAVPRLKVVFSHFAGGIFDGEELFRERLAIVASEPNAYVDSGALTFRQRYPFPRAQELLRWAVEKAGASKLAWGADYPRPGLIWDASYKQQLEFITVECAFLTEAQRAQILGGTALGVYQWDG